jgi:hypothetical protein
MPNNRQTSRFCYECPYGSGTWYTRNEYIQEFGEDIFEENEESLPYSTERELNKVKKKRWWNKE